MNVASHARPSIILSRERTQPVCILLSKRPIPFVASLVKWQLQINHSPWERIKTDFENWDPHLFKHHFIIHEYSNSKQNRKSRFLLTDMHFELLCSVTCSKRNTLHPIFTHLEITYGWHPIKLLHIVYSLPLVLLELFEIKLN
jgi:hypothetical protein